MACAPESLLRGFTATPQKTLVSLTFSAFIMRLPWVEAWQVTEGLIAEVGKEVRSHHLPLLIMITPTVHQIHPDPKEHEAYRAKYKIESLEYADDRVERCAHASGIPVLRLSKPLIEEARRTGTYMAGFANTAPNDGHFNERGHVVIANELVRAICEIASTRK